MQYESNLINSSGTKKWFVFIISILLITDLTILLDIQFLRQIFGFFFLVILPGLLIIRILKLNKLGITEKLVLAVGLSVSFLMLFGLLWNNLLLDFGYETPLSTISHLILFNVAFIVLTIIGCVINKDSNKTLGQRFIKNCLRNCNLTTEEKAFLVVPLLFPALSILGTHLMKTADNNIILMFLYLLIPAYVVFVCFFNQKFPKRLYPIVIFSISISLVLIYMLRFPYIHGRDVHTEYYFFQTTLGNLHWCMLEHSILDVCLSISLLPTIYQSLMNVNAQEYLFKGIYVSISSFLPLAIYITAKKYVGDLYAFLASFFFMSQDYFLSAATHPRTIIAIFFAALAIMVFFNDEIDPLKRRFLFIVFMLSLVVSHYSTTYIFFFVLLFCWFAVEIVSRRYTIKKNITLTCVLLFLAFIFFWYSQLTGKAFETGIRFIEDTFMNLNQFFIDESRSEVLVQQLTGKKVEYSILSRVYLALNWGIFILIGIGVFTMITRFKEMIAIQDVKHKKPDFLKRKFEMEYLAMALVCVALLIIMVALPYISKGYGIHRLYSLMIIILSVCFIMGAMTLSHFLSKERTCAKKETLFAKQKAFTEKCYRSSFGKVFLFKKRFVLKKKQKSLTENTAQNLQVRAYLIIILILIPYFLFVTGVTYQIYGDRNSIILNSGGEEYNREYIHDQDSCGAKWLMMNGETNFRIYTADGYGKHKLISQGKIPSKRLDLRSFSGHKKLKEGYIYLYYNNVVRDKLVVDGITCEMNEYLDMFIGKDKIYANGGSEVYN